MSSGQNEASAAAKKEKVLETQQRTQESGSENEASRALKYLYIIKYTY